MAMRLSTCLRAQFPACMRVSAAHLRPPHAWAPFARAPGPAAGEARGRALAASASALDAAAADRVNVYTSYTIYKSKGALNIKPIKPTWERVPSGSGISVSRDGTLLLEFAAARGERDYDWEHKATFALSAVECGEVLEAVEAGREASFFHDPNKSGSGEGDVSKTLRLSPGRESGYFLNLSVNSRAAGSQTKYDTAVSNAEMRVIRTLMQFMIPRLLGMDEVFAGAPDIRDSGSIGGGRMGGGPPF